MLCLFTCCHCQYIGDPGFHKFVADGEVSPQAWKERLQLMTFCMTTRVHSLAVICNRYWQLHSSNYMQACKTCAPSNVGTALVNLRLTDTACMGLTHPWHFSNTQFATAACLTNNHICFMRRHCKVTCICVPKERKVHAASCCACVTGLWLHDLVSHSARTGAKQH